MSWNFSDVIELLRLDLVSALLIAVLLGGGVGLQRELRGKSAGLRTNILICVGAALFTQMSQSMALLAGDPTRIAAQIVTGVGFLGAGAILHSKGHVTGLTSAATIWLVAAIGMAVGAGAIYEAAGAALLVIVILGVLGRVEAYLRTQQEVTHLSLEVEADPERVIALEQIVERAGLELEQLRSERVGDKILVDLAMRGPKRLHDKAKRDLMRSSGTFSFVESE